MWSFERYLSFQSLNSTLFKIGSLHIFVPPMWWGTVGFTVASFLAFCSDSFLSREKSTLHRLTLVDCCSPACSVVCWCPDRIALRFPDIPYPPEALYTGLPLIAIYPFAFPQTSRLQDLNQVSHLLRNFQLCLTRENYSVSAPNTLQAFLDSSVSSCSLRAHACDSGS